MKDSEELARAVALIAADELAADIVILDLRRLSDIVDFFVIASSDSDMHLNAISTGIETKLREAGIMVSHREGEPGARWILLDYLDVVVHLMHPSTRAFYALEELWGDAPLTRIESRRLAVEGLAPSGGGDDDEL